MNLRTRRAPACAALLTAAVMALAACSSPSHSAAAGTSLSPGAGQSLAGMPGATGAGDGSGPSESAMPGMTMSAAPQSAVAPAPASGHTVAISNFAFAPATLTVKVGTTVTWTNHDTDEHTVTSQNNSGPLGSSPLSTGQTFSYTFTKPGTYSYLCTIHPFMTATVTVTS